jgi:GH24 family phage-related lysozyme (muramidase)
VFADQLLSQDVIKFWDKLSETVPGWQQMTDNQRSALVSFSYNTGYSYPSSRFNTLNRVLKEKDWANFKNAIILYVNPGTSTEAGLRRRREAEGKLWRKNG